MSAFAANQAVPGLAPLGMCPGAGNNAAIGRQPEDKSTMRFTCCFVAPNQQTLCILLHVDRPGDLSTPMLLCIVLRALCCALRGSLMRLRFDRKSPTSE